MRIAATDYDGTLCLGGKVNNETLETVRRWRKTGNRFGIVTGRDRGMIAYEIIRWNIPFDFLVCCNGAMLCDNNFAVLRSQNIENSVISEILSMPSATASLHYEICREDATYLHVLHEESWFPDLGAPYTELTREEALAATDVQQIGLAYQTPLECEKHAAALNAAFAGRALAHHNGVCIDITAPDVNKADGLETLLALYGWSANALFVIGDGENDIPMLRRYNGFAVSHANETVKSAAPETYSTVGAMLAAHM